MNRLTGIAVLMLSMVFVPVLSQAGTRSARTDLPAQLSSAKERLQRSGTISEARKPSALAKGSAVTNDMLIKLDSIVASGDEKIEYRYDDGGRVIEEIRSIWENDNWVNYEKYEYSYDNEGYNDLITWFGWNDQWVYESKAELFYTDGEWSGYIISLFENDQWVEVEQNYWKVETTLDDNGKPITEIELYLDGDEWVERYRDEYTYDDNGNMLSNTWYEMYKEGSWEDSHKDEYTYDTDGNKLTKIRYEYSNDEWVESWKTEYTYDANGNMLSEIEYGLGHDEWIESWKTEYTYDANGNETSKSQFSMDNGSWMMLDEEIVTEYDLTIGIDQIVYPQTIEGNLYQVLEAKNKIVSHGDNMFYHSELTSSNIKYASSTILQSKINVAMNINSKSLLIQAPARETSFTLYSLQGRAVMKRNFSGNATIDISALSAGHYFARITAGRDLEHTVKFMVK